MQNVLIPEDFLDIGEDERDFFLRLEVVLLLICSRHIVIPPMVLRDN